MSGWSVVRWTGVLGLAAVIAQLVGVVFGFTGGVPPAMDDANKFLAYTKTVSYTHLTLPTICSV